MRNPYAPGAGQRPPELAGRDRELAPVRSRPGAGRRGPTRTQPGPHRPARRRQDRPAQHAALPGHRRLWGTGKIEARPDQSLRRPVAAALHMALRELAPRHRDPERIDYVLAVIKAFALRDRTRQPKRAPRWQPGIDVPAAQRPRGLRRHRDRPDRAVHRRGLSRHRPGRRHRAVRRRDAGRPRRQTCRPSAPRATSCPRPARR